jgi:cell division protein ZapA
MAEKPDQVQVEIFGQTYAVRAGGDPGYVEKLAAFVDEQMKDVSRASGAVDSLRIAVLTALNLADECWRLRREAERGPAPAASGTAAAADERARRLAKTLASALGE